MIPVEDCEPYFAFVQKYAKRDQNTKLSTASQVSEVNFPPKQIILSEGGISNKVYFILSVNYIKHGSEN
jgi:hypothetical protein